MDGGSSIMPRRPFSQAGWMTRPALNQNLYLRLPAATNFMTSAVVQSEIDFHSTHTLVAATFQPVTVRVQNRKLWFPLQAEHVQTTAASFLLLFLFLFDSWFQSRRWSNDFWKLRSSQRWRWSLENNSEPSSQLLPYHRFSKLLRRNKNRIVLGIQTVSVDKIDAHVSFVVKLKTLKSACCCDSCRSFNCF